MKLLEFLQEFGDESTIVAKLRAIGLLRNNYFCTKCGCEMTERATEKRDRIMFVCRKRSCRTSKSIRAGSFFENAKLGLCDCMLFIHLWSKNYSEKLMLDDFSFSKHTVVDWSRFCRELCVENYEIDDGVIGGPGTIVEIDETHIVRRKNNVGRSLSAGWLFGGIERRTDGQFRGFFKIVYNRSGPLLKHLIKQHVAAGTHIITDGWAGYTGLDRLGYIHSIVIHDENFISPSDQDVNTQLIESNWGSLKRFIRAHGTNKGNFLVEYICEWIFRGQYENVYEKLLEVIRNKYTFI